jgi:hypothetical protein
MSYQGGGSISNNIMIASISLDDESSVAHASSMMMEPEQES